MEHRSRQGRRLLLSALGSLLLAMGALGLVGCRPPAAETAPTFAPPPTQQPTSAAIDTYTVSRGTIVETIESRGQVEAKREERLMFRIGGRLEDLHAAAGDRVEEDALLAELYAEDLQRQVADAEYRLEEAQLSLDDAEAALQIEGLELDQAAATNDYAPVQRAQIALEKAAVQLEQARTEFAAALAADPPVSTVSYSYTIQLRELDYQLAEFELSQARRSREQVDTNRAIQDIRVEMAQRDVERAKRSLERAETAVNVASEKVTETKLLAPFSGVIVSISKTVGDQIVAYEPIGVLADPTDLRVTAMVLEDDVTGIAVGHLAEVRLDPYPDRAYTGTVAEIPNEPIIWQSRAAYEVTIGLDEGQDLPTAVDLGASVVIQGRSREDVLVVPDRAIITIGDRHSVEVVGADGEVERVEIEVGISDGEYTEVTAGLEEGQQVRLP